MRWIVGPFALAMLAVPVSAQQDYRAADADRRIMLDRLGIADTRPGADGSNRTAPNAANASAFRVPRARRIRARLTPSNCSNAASAMRSWSPIRSRPTMAGSSTPA